MTLKKINRTENQQKQKQQGLKGAKITNVKYQISEYDIWPSSFWHAKNQFLKG